MSMAFTNAQAEDTSLHTATFAAGCFWCVESEFEAIDGVKDVVSGYMGGDADTATYEKVSTKKTDHIEAIQLQYDPEIISYEKLLDAFWRIHNPTQADGQGVDIGPQYMSAIFYHTLEQQQAAQVSRQAFDASDTYEEPVATRIEAASTFYPAEGYHQDYYTKKGIKYDSVFDLGGESTTIKKQKKWNILK